MSNEAPDDPTTEIVDGNAAAEAAATAAEEEQQLREEAEAKRWRAEQDNRRAALGEAEDFCAFLLDDLLVGIFKEMQVRAENDSLFAMATRQACFQVFEGADMAVTQPADTLDHILGTKEDQSGRQQVLKTQEKRTPSVHLRGTSSSTILFLRRLLKFLETRTDRVELELQRFPSSEAVAALSGRRKLIGGGGIDHRGEWCIPVDRISDLLLELAAKGLVSVLPSAVSFVLEANRESFDKKHHMRAALPQLQHFVEKAVLVAEEEEEEEKKCRCPPVDVENNVDTESTPRSQIFQTEVALRFDKGSSGQNGPPQELLSSYLVEPPPKAVEMDRLAPRRIAKKTALGATNPTRRALSRKILMMMAATPRQNSKWTNIRKKIIIPSPDEGKTDGVTAITAEADMELRLASEGNKQPGLGSISEKKMEVASGEDTLEDTPDAAALSNIFSLGTPRQLSAHELARRNDLLAQLEREAARAQRRTTTTAIASMSLAGPSAQDNPVSPSQIDQQRFQAYVAANSVVMSGIESGTQPSTLSPTRPDQAPVRRRDRGGNAGRSKFEAERDSLSYTISDGNAHIREERERLSAAVCSPIKRHRSTVTPSPPPETPGRPIQTASTVAHLPQLDSARLAVGVSAVVRGIEKRGPRRNPSRKSRLQLHNYSKAFDDDDDDPVPVETNGGASMPFSPVRTSGSLPVATRAKGKEESSRGYRLPLIPVTSPIRASPHRKHIAFKFNGDAGGDRASQSNSPKAQEHQQSPSKAKQLVWETKTISPPRARNRHFASGKHFRKFQHYSDDEEESASARRQKREEHDVNIFRQPMAAPRRSVLPAHSELDNEN